MNPRLKLRDDVAGNGDATGGIGVEQVRRALLDDAQDTRDASGPAREEVPGTSGLLHRGVASVWFGERGQGKSTALLAAGMGAAATGERVLYLDRENGGALTRQRIETLFDAHPDWGDLLNDERFCGRHYAEMDRDWPGETFGAAVAGIGFTVVIYDSAREWLAQIGLNPDKDDVTRFLNLAVTPLIRRGVAVALSDNVGVEDKTRPKGSGSKLDALPQAYKVTTVEEFSPVRVGRIKLACTRSRYGDVNREWSMRVGGEVFELPTALTEAPDAKAAREIGEKRERFRRAGVEALRDHRKPLGRNALIAEARNRGAKGSNEKLREWLSEFAADPASGLVSTDAGYALGPHGPGDSGHVGATPPEAPMAREDHTPPLKGGVVPGQGLGPESAAMAGPLLTDAELRELGLELLDDEDDE